MTDKNINSEQEKAIKQIAGPVIVVAGAGTGKTTVITERINYLITKHLAKPQEILALTFSEKAAEEMNNRIEEIMPLGYEEPWISTFHSFCDRILKDEGIEIGIDSSYKILTSADQWILLKKNLFELGLEYYLPLSTPTKFITALLSFFSRLKDETITSDQIVKFASTNLKVVSTSNSEDKEADIEEAKKIIEVAQAYQKYNNLLIANNSLDFGDLLFWVIKLFTTRPSVLKKYQKQFKYILIDEFQDTNTAQFELIKLIAPPSKKPNLMVVGDDDQSIYRFRGAAISNILEFQKIYSKAEDIVLTNNYRSTQAILDSAYNLIQNNNPERLEVKLNINKKLISQSAKSGSFPKVYSFEKNDIEANFIAKEILTKVNKGENKFSDFAILSRANNHLDQFVFALRNYGIPYSLLGNRGLFDQEEIRGIISFIRFLVNPHDNASLYQIMISPHFSISSDSITFLMNISNLNNQDVWSSIKNEKENKEILNLKENLEKFMALIKTKSPSLLIYEILLTTPYVKSLASEESIENNLKIQNINIFFEKVKTFENQTKNSNLFEFVDYLNLLIEAGENPAQAEIEDIDTVKLLTIHSAKGLEFENVYLVNLVSDRFPSRERKEQISIPNELIHEKYLSENYHLQEERRLFYVGITRAKKELTLTWSKNYGGTRTKKPSGFIGEMKLPDTSSQNEFITQLSFLDQQDNYQNQQIKSQSNQKAINLSKISFSQLETFRTCPLKYFYKYIIKIPGSPSHILSFGQTLHRTLRDFHKIDLFSQEKKSKEYILNLYSKHFQYLGYDNSKHQEERYKQGEKILSEYFEKHQKILQGQPIYIEKNFKVKIENVTLVGSIDRIDLLPDQTYEIIDYKTGSGSSSLKKEENIDKDEQLLIYALAAKESPEINLNVSKLSLLFIERLSKATTDNLNPESLEKEKEIITSQVNEINSRKASRENFEPKVGYHCAFCEFNKICPAYKVGQNNF